MANRLYPTLTVGALLVAFTALFLQLDSQNSAHSAITRIAKTPPRPTLDAVILPAGTEIMMLSGQGPDPLDPTKIDGPNDFGDTKTQAANIFGKIKTLLEKHGYTMKDVVKLTVFVAGDPNLDGKADFKGMNEAYAMYFATPDNPDLPARSAIQVAALARPGYRLEVEAIAAKTHGK